MAKCLYVLYDNFIIDIITIVWRDPNGKRKEKERKEREKIDPF